MNLVRMYKSLGLESPTKGFEVGRGIVSGPPVAILVSELSGVCATTSGRRESGDSGEGTLNLI